MTSPTRACTQFTFGSLHPHWHRDESTCNSKSKGPWQLTYSLQEQSLSAALCAGLGRAWLTRLTGFGGEDLEGRTRERTMSRIGHKCNGKIYITLVSLLRTMGRSAGSTLRCVALHRSSNSNDRLHTTVYNNVTRAAPSLGEKLRAVIRTRD